MIFSVSLLLFSCTPKIQSNITEYSDIWKYQSRKTLTVLIGNQIVFAQKESYSKFILHYFDLNNKEHQKTEEYSFQSFKKIKKLENKTEIELQKETGPYPFEEINGKTKIAYFFQKFADFEDFHYSTGIDRRIIKVIIEDGILISVTESYVSQL